MSQNPVEVYLSSKYASVKLNSTYNSDLIFYLKTPIFKPRGYNLKMKVTNFVFPISFTTIDNNNNRLYVGGVLYTLTTGNYSATTLITMLDSILPSSYTINYDTARNKYTFTNTSDFTFNATSSCFILLGFAEGVSYSSSGNSLTSPFVVNLSGQYNVLYIDIPNISTQNISSYAGQRTSIIKSIPVSQSLGSIMYFENLTDSHCLIQETTIAMVHARILGEDLVTLVDFQGQYWNITLEFSFIEDDKELLTKVQQNLGVPFD